jgi:hypothetical protein
MFAAMSPDIKNVVIVSGDGDFAECVRGIQELAHKRVFMFGWKGSVNHKLAEVLEWKPYYFDEIWDKFTRRSPEYGDDFMQDPINWDDYYPEWDQDTFCVWLTTKLAPVLQKYFD